MEWMGDWRERRRLPFAESLHAFFEITPRFVFWVCYRLDGDVGEATADRLPEVFWKSVKGIISALGRG